MKKLSHDIEIVNSMVNDLIENNRCKQMRLHNDKLSDKDRDHEESRVGVLTAKIEALCSILGMQIRWPGLYPNFEVEGKWYHKFKDALAATFGCDSFAILLEREASGWEPNCKLHLVNESIPAKQVDALNESPTSIHGEHDVVIEAIEDASLGGSKLE